MQLAFSRQDCGQSPQEEWHFDPCRLLWTQVIQLQTEPRFLNIFRHRTYPKSHATQDSKGDADVLTHATSMTLIRQLRESGDSVAWNRFNEIYAGLIEGWLRRRGVPEHVAEDVRQEVLAKVFEEIGSFEHNGRLGAFRKWLRTVMQHRLRTLQRRAWRQGEDQRHDWSEVAEQLGDDNSELSRLWDAEHDSYVIDRLLKLVAEEFTEQSMQAFRRVVLKDEDVTQVANDLGITINAVRIAKTRVLAALRRLGHGLLSDF